VRLAEDLDCLGLDDASSPARDLSQNVFSGQSSRDHPGGPVVVGETPSAADDLDDFQGF